MSKTDRHEPRPERVPAQRARGLDPEITAQPRPIPDELALEASAEPELSLDPEDIGSHFLSEAIEQGDFDPERAWTSEVSLIDSPAPDQPDEIEEDRKTDTTEVRSKEPWRVGQSSMREFSLLDREGEEGDETIPPNVEFDEHRSDVRTAPWRELGQHDESSERKQLHGSATLAEMRAPHERVRLEARASAPESAAPPPQHQSERLPSMRTSALRTLRAFLTHAAWMVRRLARLER